MVYLHFSTILCRNGASLGAGSVLPLVAIVLHLEPFLNAS